MERLVGVLDTQPSVGLAYTQSWLVDTTGNKGGDANCWTDDLDPKRWHSDFVNGGIDEIDQFLLKKNCIPNASAVMLRSSVLDAVGAPDTAYRLCGDWLYWIKILAISDIAFIAQPLNYWRQNSSNVRAYSPGTLEWIEGEKILQYGLEIIAADKMRQNGVMLDFLHRCWRWQRDYIESFSKS
jgi:hypothetical protein